jgi:hypothetical protein
VTRAYQWFCRFSPVVPGESLSAKPGSGRRAGSDGLGVNGVIHRRGCGFIIEPIADEARLPAGWAIYRLAYSGTSKEALRTHSFRRSSVLDELGGMILHQIPLQDLTCGIAG